MSQVTDKLLARTITFTVCALAGVCVLAMGYQTLRGYESDGNLKELTYLIVGALVGQITTRGNKDEPEGTQQVSVPDPLPAPAAPAEPEPEYKSEFGYSAVEWLLLLAAGTALGLVLGTLILRNLG